MATKEGLPIAFEIFDGNRTDVTTAKEMVELMETKYGKTNRVWVLDRGMVSEDNLEFMRNSKTRYLVGTPTKSLLKKFEEQLLEESWEKVQPGVEVRLCSSPEGADETFVVCRSVGRKEKETTALSRGLRISWLSWPNGPIQAQSEINRKWSGRSVAFWNATAVPRLSSPSR